MDKSWATGIENKYELERSVGCHGWSSTVRELCRSRSEVRLRNTVAEIVHGLLQLIDENLRQGIFVLRRTFKLLVHKGCLSYDITM